jgi:tRNA(Arg) A34 adenosine deaminase TadA
MKTNEDYLRMAVRLARKNVEEQGGRPFAAVLVKNGEIIATGVNEIRHARSIHARRMQAIAPPLRRRSRRGWMAASCTQAATRARCASR